MSPCSCFSGGPQKSEDHRVAPKGAQIVSLAHIERLCTLLSLESVNQHKPRSAAASWLYHGTPSTEFEGEHVYDMYALESKKS